MQRCKGTNMGAAQIAASIIGAIRLAREDIRRPAPMLADVLGDSVRFATGLHRVLSVHL
jgi:hypothetical protein